MVWFKRFYDPIILPDGRELDTLRDAVHFITELPKVEHDTAEWQLAMEALLLVAEPDGPEMLARIAVMKALNRHGNGDVSAAAETGQGFSDCSVIKAACRLVGSVLVRSSRA